MVCVEGFHIDATRISEKKLIKAWKTLSRKQLPKIKALKLSDEDFEHIIHQRRCIEDECREIEEWGKIIPAKSTDACVFNANETKEAKYIILIRENPYHSLDEIIVHELSHIARGDL